MEKPAGMCLNCVDGYKQSLGDLLVAFALGYEGKDGTLALGQAGEG